MTSLPKISVITVCFNSARTISETLRSVAEQDYPNVEHVIVDGGSSDGTVEILRRTSGILWISERDAGIYDAMNKGILRATGDIIGILNSDDRYRPGTLRKVGESFVNHPEWDALFGDVIFIDANGTEIYRRREAKYDYNVLRLSGICYVIHPTLFVRKVVYNQLGLYRHKEYLLCADFDFILRLGKYRRTVGHLRDFLAEFRYHPHGHTSDLRVLVNLNKERRCLLAEHGAPRGKRGQLLRLLMLIRRQVQKLLYRGAVDWRRGDSLLKRHRHEQGKISSNAPLESL